MWIARLDRLDASFDVLGEGTFGMPTKYQAR